MYRFQEFVLAILPDGQNFQARVLASPVGQASIDFVPPFQPDDVRAIDSSGWSAAPALLGMSYREIGEELFYSLFAGGIGEAFYRSLETLDEDEGLRIVLRLSDVPALAVFPWEFLYDPQGERFLALDARTPLVRYLELPVAEPATLLVDPPLRILTVLANPPNSPAPLDVAEEWKRLTSALAGLAAQGIVHLEQLEPPTLGALRRRLQAEKFHVLHFVGHGEFDSRSNNGGLLFERADGSAHLVLDDELKVVLHNHPTLRLVFLNACHGAVSSLDNPFTGVAQSLVRQAMPAVIAMQGQISDRAAQVLAEEFYTALTHNQPTDRALTEARVALYTEQSLEWATPVLYSRSRSNQLVRLALPPPPCPYPGMAPFGPEQQQFFFGREEEIRDGASRLDLHPFLAVIGPSGSGKSSLVKVGIVPALCKKAASLGQEIAVRSMRPGPNPQQRLADLFAVETEGLSQIAPETPILLVIDQLEELFTQAPEQISADFLARIVGLIGRENIRILVTVRADFYPALMASPLWPAIRGNRLELSPLDRADLRAVIVKPAEAVGVRMEDGLVERLIADAAGDAGALPFLQETLVQMWGEMAERTLTLAAYEAMGSQGRTGLQSAIARRADVTYGNLSDSEQVVARRIFLRLIQFGEGKNDFRRQLALADLTIQGEDPKEFDGVLQTLAADRLLTLNTDTVSDQQLADISHEALLEGWPQLATWRRERKEAEIARRRFEARAEAFVRRNRTGGLLDAVELLEIERWLGGTDAAELGGASQILQDLIKESSRAIAEAEARAEAGRRREVALERKGRRRAQALVALLTVLLIFFLGRIAQDEYLRWQARTSGAVAAVVGQAGEMETLEVSNQRYGLCVQTGRCTPPFRQFSTYYEDERQDFPVTGVSALQAAQFCDWIGRRLPRRSEWLAAATNGGRTLFPWKDGPPSPDRANLLYGDDPRQTERVGDRPGGANETGIQDLIGNVFEWTSTCYEDGAGDCGPAGEWDGAAETLPRRLYIMGGSFATSLSGIQTLENNAQSESPREFFGFRCYAAAD